MLRHRESVYWQSVRWMLAVPAAIVLASGSDAWKDVRWMFFAVAAASSAGGFFVALRQGHHIDLAWTEYSKKWGLALAKNPWTFSVRTTFLILFGLFAVVLAVASWWLAKVAPTATVPISWELWIGAGTR